MSRVLKLMQEGKVNGTQKRRDKEPDHTKIRKIEIKLDIRDRMTSGQEKIIQKTENTEIPVEVTEVRK